METSNNIKPIILTRKNELKDNVVGFLLLFSNL